VLTIFHLVWCALFWLLAHPDKIGARRVAMLALMAGALPRVFLAIARLPTAWMNNEWGFADLIAFEALTALWLIYLAMQSLGHGATANKLAFPMMVFAAVECIGGLVAAAGVVSALMQGVLVSAWWKVPAAVFYGVAQVWYLREAARQSLQPEPHWNRL
jgi:hypothetical protein